MSLRAGMGEIGAVLLLQTRTRSSRLPAKAFLPLAGMPAVMLAVRRATNTGLPLIAATSVDPSDEHLVDLFEDNGVETFRGSLNDVLGRLAAAADGFVDEMPVVRLTGDNIFPDGAFIEEMLSAFRRGSRPYMSVSQDSLPYGLSAEIFTAGLLREAEREAASAYEREHVTPYMIDRYGGNTFTPSELMRTYSQMRVTLDSIDDYLRLQALCRRVGQERMVSISWLDLCNELVGLTETPKHQLRRAPNSDRSLYVLGTAQLGMSYGVTNKAGLPSVKEAQDIICLALDHGIEVFDCARAYGEAENRLGSAIPSHIKSNIEIHTKLDSLSECDDASASELEAKAENSVLRSCHELGVKCIDVLLLHRWMHRHIAGDAVWKTLLRLRAEGLIGRLGVSVYAPDQALEALADPDIEYIQFPFNLLDWRWKQAGVAVMAQQRPEVVMEARSVLLQGLLANSLDAWPVIDQVSSSDYRHRLDQLAQSLGRRNRADLCYAYVAAQDWIASIVVGMETAQQMTENLELFHSPPLSLTEAELVERTLPKAPAELLDPTKWPKL